jgi:hypothetical protein
MFHRAHHLAHEHRVPARREKPEGRRDGNPKGPVRRELPRGCPSPRSDALVHRVGGQWCISRRRTRHVEVAGQLRNSLGRAERSPLPLFMVGPEGPATEARIGRTAKWARDSSTPTRTAMRFVRWMLPTCGRWSKATSPLRPRARGFRASWSRRCRCRQRTGTHRAAPAEAEVHEGHQDPRTRSLTERPLCISNQVARQQQRMDVARLAEHRSPTPAGGGSSPSVHANRGRSHGHRTRDLAERPASSVAPG